MRNDDQGARQVSSRQPGGKHTGRKIRPSGYRDSPPVTVTPSNRSRYFAHAPRTCDSPSGIGGGSGEKNGKKKAKKKCKRKRKEEKLATGRTRASRAGARWSRVTRGTRIGAFGARRDWPSFRGGEGGRREAASAKGRREVERRAGRPDGGADTADAVTSPPGNVRAPLRIPTGSVRRGRR